MTIKLKFPTMLRKMWSGGEVQAWIDARLAEIEGAAPAAPRDDAWLDQCEELIANLSMASYVHGAARTEDKEARRAKRLAAGEALKAHLRARPAAPLPEPVAPFGPDEITANLVRHAGLNKHKARECEAIVRQVLAAAPAAPLAVDAADRRHVQLQEERGDNADVTKRARLDYLALDAAADRARRALG